MAPLLSPPAPSLATCLSGVYTSSFSPCLLPLDLLLLFPCLCCHLCSLFLSPEVVFFPPLQGPGSPFIGLLLQLLPLLCSLLFLRLSGHFLLLFLHKSWYVASFKLRHGVQNGACSPLLSILTASTICLDKADLKNQTAHIIK